jgi:hypothetical protein
LHFDEVPVKQAMLNSATQVIAVITADKMRSWPSWQRALFYGEHSNILKCGNFPRHQWLFPAFIFAASC